MMWASDGAPLTAGVTREMALPIGAMHIAIRLGDQPLCIFADARDEKGESVGTSVLNGVRVRAYCRQVGDPVPSVGAVLRPGAVELLSRAPAGVLASRHTRLEDLWPARELSRLLQRLHEAPSLDARLLVLEDMLSARLPHLRGIDPLIAHALMRFDEGATVKAFVIESGFSHRHVARQFTEAVGVGPKTYLRLLRFNRTLAQLHARPELCLAEVSIAMGYADQAHMTREFKEFSTFSPDRFRRIAPAHPRHVPLFANGTHVSFLQDTSMDQRESDKTN
ncbi:MAG: helix-turn-helix transcriptional regulator [Alphaproteobacteria bacterium]|nr:helix-turn-helix transcriptional regulator [Alphaproteobacteria bacterium]